MNRILQLQKRMTGEAAVIRSGVSRFYLTGFSSSAGTLLVTREKAFFLADSRYIEAAREQLEGCEVLLEENDRQLGELIAKLQIKEIAFETHAASVDEADRLQRQAAPAVLLRDGSFSRVLLEMRCQKDAYELGCLRKAQEITDSAFAALLGQIRPGASELELMMFFGEHMARLGCEKRSFNMIFTSGSRTALPHGDPAIRTVEQGDFVMMDVGAMVGGYAADMTRTVAVGQASEEQKKVYAIVLEAQKRALDAVRAGKRCCDIDSVARDYIRDAGFGDCFGHGLGHSLGLEIHENPRFNQSCETVLLENMVMTVEPGIYLPNRFGVRIEDMVAVTENGCDNFTKSPKELIVL